MPLLGTSSISLVQSQSEKTPQEISNKNSNREGSFSFCSMHKEVTDRPEVNSLSKHEVSPNQNSAKLSRGKSDSEKKKAHYKKANSKESVESQVNFQALNLFSYTEVKKQPAKTSLKLVKSVDIAVPSKKVASFINADLNLGDAKKKVTNTTVDGTSTSSKAIHESKLFEPLAAEAKELHTSTAVEGSKSASRKLATHTAPLFETSVVAQVTHSQTEQKKPAKLMSDNGSHSLVNLSANQVSPHQLSQQLNTPTLAAQLAKPILQPEKLNLNQSGRERVIQQQFNWQLQNKQQKATLRLHPSELGQLHIQIQVASQHTQVQVIAPNHQVQNTLHQHLHQLQYELAQNTQGSVHVDVSAQNNSGQSQQNQQQQSGNQPSYLHRTIEEKTVLKANKLAHDRLLDTQC